MQYPALRDAATTRYYEAGHWRSDTIWDVFARIARERSNKVAIRQGDVRSVSYGGLIDQIERTARLLEGTVGPGDVVTICGPNWVDTVVAILSALRTGAVASPLPVTCGPKDLQFAIEKCRSKAVFVSGVFRSTNAHADVTSILSRLSVQPRLFLLTSAGDDRLRDVEPVRSPVSGHADAPAAILFTSGTESRSKAAVHTSNTILFGERTLAEALNLTENDVAFMASPISHATGFLHGVVMTLTLGGTLSLMDQFDAELAFDQIKDHAATWTMGATPFLAETTHVAERRNETLPTLRYFLVGGAPVPPVITRRARASGLTVLNIYGSTESPPHTLVHPGDPPEASADTDGRPLAGIETRIVAPDGTDVAEGEVGEQWSRGPNAFIGYLGEPELSAQTLDKDGWYRSGDLAQKLPGGFLRITGRLKDIIIRGGQNISAREVEEMLLTLPGCSEAAVVAIPHERLGETGCAVLVMRDGQKATLGGVTTFLNGYGIAKYKIPERVEIWQHLPRTPSGKIQKSEIRRKLLEAVTDA